MTNAFANWLLGHHVGREPALLLATLASLAVILAVSLLTYAVVRTVVLKTAFCIVGRTRTTWDENVLFKHGVLRKVCWAAPLLLAHRLVPLAFTEENAVASGLQTTVLVGGLILGALVVDSLLNAGLDFYKTTPSARDIPIKGFIQVVKLVIYLIAFLLALATVVGKSPLVLLSGVGAMTAVLMLIFRDAILGFVAGIQLTANRMVSTGDWISMPQYGADGDVVDVALTTVKVQNWDKTITTIPTYALISESFKNYRGMQESGGRRIMRTIYIDVSTIRFCDEEMLERFSHIQYISEYLARKRREVADYNRQHGIDQASRVNGRRLTNLGTFRAYVDAYLRHHPFVNLEMTFLVRHLQPTEHGLPIQIYVFCKEKAWADYERIQADIFDHILAVVQEFDLRLFQNPSGYDFRALTAEGFASPVDVRSAAAPE